MFRNLKKSDYIKMPWANGMGMTTELAIGKHAPERTDSPFLWRISIAGVKEDGPFSDFPNIDRHLMLIDGNGITLDGGEHGIGVLFEPMQHYSFPGDIELSGKLVDGPITDLNLMVDRRFAKADMSGFYLTNPEKLALRSNIHFIHLIEGSAPVVLDVEGELTELAGGDSLEISDTNALATLMALKSDAEPPAVVFISINLKA